MPPELESRRDATALAGTGAETSQAGASKPAKPRRARVDLDELDRESKRPSGREPGPELRVGRSATRDAELQAAESARPLVGTALTVELAQRDSFRGERVAVSGTLRSDDGAPGGLPIDIYLDGPGGAILVGHTVAGADGAFATTIEVPRDLTPGDHRVVARTPGDDRHKPSSTPHLRDPNSAR
jgi:hypothetical protein